jgi:hypothetical protein
MDKKVIWNNNLKINNFGRYASKIKEVHSMTPIRKVYKRLQESIPEVFND